MTTKSAIFWDFDGVIADSTDFVFHYWQKAFKELGYTFTLEDYQATFTAKFPFDYLKEHFGLSAEQIKVHYTDYEETHYADHVGVFPGLPEIIKACGQNHTQQFVVSSNLKSVIKSVLSEHKLDGYFDTIIGREVPGYKDEKITKIMTEQDLQPENCCYVGDTTSDMKHAKNAGISRFGVTWGVHTKTQMKESEAQFLCDTPNELRTILLDASQ